MDEIWSSERFSYLLVEFTAQNVCDHVASCRPHFRSMRSLEGARRGEVSGGAFAVQMGDRSRLKTMRVRTRTFGEYFAGAVAATYTILVRLQQSPLDGRSLHYSLIGYNFVQPQNRDQLIRNGHLRKMAGNLLCPRFHLVSIREMSAIFLERKADDW